MKINAGILILFLLSGISCTTVVEYTNSKTHFYTPDKSSEVLIDSSAFYIIQPYRDTLNQSMSEVLAHSNHAMEKGQPESKLGNFVADLCFLTGSRLFNSESGTSLDFCVLNNGGLRSSLPAGNITRKNVYELMPFDNELVVLKLDGKTTFELMEYIAGRGGVPVSNLRMKISNDKPEDVFIYQLPFDINRTYYILTSDYLAHGGDAMEMFSKATHSVNLGIKVRDAIIEYLAEINSGQQIINVETDGRITR